MLFSSPSHRRKNNLTFTEQLLTFKQKTYTPPELQQQADTFQLTVRILDLLIDKNPKITQQLFMLKSSITNWYEHNKHESINRIREIFNLKENLQIRVKKEIGIVLEQIAYYLRNIVEDYNDKNIQFFYVKYLNAIKKLHWGRAFADQEQQPDLVNAEIQTENNPSFRPFRTQQSIDQSNQTMESPKRKERQLNIQNYLDTKQENLNLQRNNDYLKQMLAKQQEQNKKLKLEISKLIGQNDDYKDEQKKYMEQVSKLTKLLDQLKDQNEELQQKQDYLRMTFGDRENKFEKLGDLKEQLHKQLNSVQQNLEKTHSESSVQVACQKENFFANNYKVTESSQDQPTIKKINKPQTYNFNEQSDQFNEIYRMLFVQALSIEDEVIPSLEVNRNRKKQVKRYSHNTIMKSDTL